RLLLFGAAAQLLLQPDPLGDFVTDAEHAHRDALLEDHLARRLDPAILALLPRDHTIPDPVRLAGLQRVLDGLDNARPILFVYVALKEGIGAIECAGSQAM